MSQMSPLTWFSLCSIVLILFNQMNVLSFKPTPITSAVLGTIESKNLTWTW